MEKGYIQLIDDKIIPIKELPQYISFVMVRFYSEHREVCLITEKTFNCNFNEDQRKVFFNFLHIHALSLRYITAAILFSKKNKIKTLVSDVITKEYKSLFPYEITFQKENISKNKLVKGYSLFIKSFIKLLINKAFRSYGSIFQKKAPSKSVIRAWTLRSLTLFKDQLDDSILFVYPYGLSLKRALLSIKKFRKHNYVYMGFPYSFRDLLKIPFNPIFNYICFEYNAYVKHCIDFENYGNIYTSDDFSIASVVIHQRLIKNKISVTNSAHGIGFYSPYVAYTNFYVFNEQQMLFYKEYNSQINFFYKQFSEAAVKLPTTEAEKNLSQIILIDQGDFKSKGLLLEHELQQKLYKICNDISENNSILVYLKYHPLAPIEFINRIKIDYPFLKLTNDLDTFLDKKSILLTLYSTAYYDFSKYGEVYFITSPEFNPRYLFGQNIRSIDISILSQTLIQKFKS